MLTQYRCFILHRHPVSLILMYGPLGYRPIKQRRKENVGENGIRLTAGFRGIEKKHFVECHGNTENQVYV